VQQLFCFESVKVIKVGLQTEIGDFCYVNRYFNRLLKNVVEAADARQIQAKKQILLVINAHAELVFNLKTIV